MSLRRNIAYVGGALAVVSAVTSIVAWWLPSSATWLDRHGFVAWPLAVLALLLFVWAALNWQQATQELATVRAEVPELVPADRQLFSDFKTALPKDAAVLAWLRNCADTRIYHRNDLKPLVNFVYTWREADQHFVNPELEQAGKQLVACGMDFLSYQRTHSFVAPQHLQAYREGDDDCVFEYPFSDDRKQRELDRELGERADNVLAAHNELYMVGSRLGL